MLDRIKPILAAATARASPLTSYSFDACSYSGLAFIQFCRQANLSACSNFSPTSAEIPGVKLSQRLPAIVTLRKNAMSQVTETHKKIKTKF